MASVFSTSALWRDLLLFLASVMALNLLLEPLFRNDLPPAIARKLDYYAEHRNDYDTLFVGPSFVMRHVSPSAFDRACNAAGWTTHSFNLGFLGMTFYETDALLDRILALEPKRLRTVFIDAGSFLRPSLKFPRDNWFTERALWWLTPDRAWEQGRLALAQNAELAPLIRYLWAVGLHAATRSLHVGKGLSWFEGSDGKTALEVPDLEGFVPHRFQDPAFSAAEWETAVGEWRRSRATPPRDALARNRRLVERQIAKLEAAGIEPIYLVAPILDPGPEASLLDAAGVLPTLLRYDDPSAHPQLFEYSARHDRNHLQREAALLYSRRIARDYVDHARAKRGS